MKLTVAKSRSTNKNRYMYNSDSDSDATGAGKAKKLRSSATTVLSSWYVLLSDIEKIPLTYPRLGSSPITVLVGPMKVEVYAHKVILTSSSAYLKNALKPEWQGPNKTQIVLRSCDADSLRIYVNWLYTGQFKMTDGPAENSKAKTEIPAAIDREWTMWAQCYELANFLQDSDCKDALIDMSIEKMTSDKEYVVELPSLIYLFSRSQSPSRKLAVEIALYIWSQETINGVDQANHPAEFLADVVKAGLRRNTSSTEGVRSYFKQMNTCVYHEHTLTNTPCYKVKRGV